MGKNRDHLSIVANILVVSNPAASKSHIMRKANLSYLLVEKYLEQIITAGLVRAEGSKYISTEAGRSFLKRYEEYYSRQIEAERSLESLNCERQSLLRMCDANKFIGSIVEVQ